MSRPIEDLAAEPIPQKEWGFGGRRKYRDGWLLLAFFIGGIGAGQFIVSTWIVSQDLGALVGLIIVTVGKSVTHILYLGRPIRFWRILSRPRTSWLSRGFISMILFIVFAALHLAPSYGFLWTAEIRATPLGVTILSIATAAAFVLMTYDGLLLLSARSISAWNTAMMPALFAAYSLSGGVALTTLLELWLRSTLLVGTLWAIDITLLSIISILILLYLITMIDSTTSARKSLRELMLGRVAPFFIAGGIISGLIIPIILVYYTHTPYSATASTLLLVIAAVLALSGDLLARHSLLKVGFRIPIIQP